ncbi:MAG: hypothetical protein OXN23_06925 [Gammaproteobacteria bacterium]|nr:hypothetical protein [Gammaproteobacteria bacterium]
MSLRMILLAATAAASLGGLAQAGEAPASDPAEVLHGERLFLETRFAQRFHDFVTRGGNINGPLDQGDPKLEKTYRFFGLPPYQIPFAPGPFEGSSYNCRTCHLVDEHVGQQELGMRAYNDFASRSPLPERDDGQSVTVRNSPVLVGSLAPRDPFLLHVDGEFASAREVIIATLTGRNLGWLPDEGDLAARHACEVIRKDDGTGALAKEFGGFSYSEVFSSVSGSGEALPEEHRIAAELRIYVPESSCDEILIGVANLIEHYLADLKFSKEADILSPYDQFLLINDLPTRPDAGESDEDYSDRLLAQINSLNESGKLQFVERNPATEDGGFRFHDQPYRFGEIELQGLRIFFNRKPAVERGVGNCGSCHAAPHFTDFGFHNIGVTQVEYEAIHGQGSFWKLLIPTAGQRNEQANIYLPATAANPDRQGMFRRPASESEPMATDLGAWNIFMNEDYPNAQEPLHRSFCQNGTGCKTADQALEQSIAAFKTPTLRDLGHSAPYMHNGQISDLHASVAFYIAASASSRNGTIRNADPELRDIRITPNDIQPLVSFLISLYEDYE